MIDQRHADFDNLAVTPFPLMVQPPRPVPLNLSGVNMSTL